MIRKHGKETLCVWAPGHGGPALSHAHGAAFDNTDLLVTCVIGDGEAETGPLAASWHSNKFLPAPGP